jgi:hypothetical protein
VCVTGACGVCGRAGQPCCESSCSAAQTTCRMAVGQGESPMCLACGGPGQPCCFDQPSAGRCASPALVCGAGLCLER